MKWRRPAYWRDHLMQPVQFATAMQTLAERGYETFLEIGPQPNLLAMGRSCLPGAGPVWLPSLRRRRGDWQQLLASLQTLYLLGAQVDWQAFDRDYQRQWVDLPNYPFQRQRFWAAPAATEEETKETSAAATVSESHGHVLLAIACGPPAFADTVYENRFTATSPNYLPDHRIFSLVLVPGASHLTMVLSAAAEAHRPMPLVLET